MSKIKKMSPWSSPIDAKMAASATLNFGHLSKTNESLIFSETRPCEKGRIALLSFTKTSIPSDLLPTDFSVKSAVNQYGGKCFTSHGNTIYFYDRAKGALFCKKKEIELILLTPDEELVDLCVDLSGRLLFAVSENKLSHCASIIQINLVEKSSTCFHKGEDFYACLKLSPCGEKIAFLSWNHPNMPWDESALWHGLITKPETIKKHYHQKSVSIGELFFSSTNRLYFTSNQKGHYSFYELNELSEPLADGGVDFSLPFWTYGNRRIEEYDSERLVLIGTQKGVDSVYLFNLKNRELTLLPFPFTAVKEITVFNGELFFIAQSPTLTSSLVHATLSTEFQIIKSSSLISIDTSFIPSCTPINIGFQETEIYGFYYGPQHKEFEMPDGIKPPMIIRVHSGPTTHLPPRLNLENLFYTTRGFAIFEINYSGSSGYGTAYQKKLNHQWGEKETSDVVEATNFLIEHGYCHEKQIYLLGSSAGGYTILQLLTKTALFKAAACLYPVSDLIALSKQTHKFEKHYLESLVGSLPSCTSRYMRRSPINHAEKITTPLILFHGKQDPVVSYKQSLSLYEKIDKSKTKVQIKLYENESHGFKNQETTEDVLTSTLAFFSSV